MGWDELGWKEEVCASNLGLNQSPARGSLGRVSQEPSAERGDGARKLRKYLSTSGKGKLKCPYLRYLEVEVEELRWCFVLVLGVGH